MPIFTPIQIVKLIDLAKKKNRIAPIYLFIGPEQICKEKAKEIYEVLKEKNSFLEMYDLKIKEGQEAFLQIKGYQRSLFGIRKIYFILGAEHIPYEKGEEIVKSLKESNEIFSWFLISNTMDEIHPLYKYAFEKGAIILFTTKKEEDFLETELILKLKEYQKTMDKNTANLFLSLVGKDYHYFKGELSKLIFYTADKAIITEEDILDIIIPSEGDALYLLADLFFNHGPEKAYRLTLTLLDRKIEAPKILSYLYKYFKKMEILKEFLEKNPELAKEERYSNFNKKWEELKENPLIEIPKILLDTHPFVLFNMKKQLSKVKNFKLIFEELFRADLSIKKDFKNPGKIFGEFFLNLWFSFEKKY